MREILFRGKRCDNGEWVQGYYIKADHHWHKHGIHKDWIVCGASANGGWFALHNKYAVKAETVGQFTVLTDKNGKKIFEGDICKDKHDKLWEVKFGEYTDCSDGMQVGFYYSRQRKYANGSVGEECFCMLCSTYQPESFEVIGNIHDNPELLENP